MAPKGLSQEQKHENILEFLRSSRTCHTLKDLETSLPSAAKINKMQIKDLIKELTDEDKVKVEKIGSGNWYWTWAGEEAAQRTSVISQLEAEQIKHESAIEDLQQQVEEAKTHEAATQDDCEHQTLLVGLQSLEDEVRALTVESDQWENAASGGAEGKRANIVKSKQAISEITDNIQSLESHLLRLVGGDTNALDNTRRSCYGEMYGEGGGGMSDIEGI